MSQQTSSCSNTTSDCLKKFYIYCHYTSFTIPLYSIYYHIWVSLICLNIIAAPFTIFFNLLTLCAVYRCQQLRYLSNYLLCGLALTDIGTGIIIQPLLATSFISILQFNASCHLLVLTISIGFYLSIVSQLMLLCVFIDRYVAIFHCYKYTTIQLGFVSKVIIAMWISPIMLLTVDHWEQKILLSPIIMIILQMAVFSWSFYVQVRICFVVRRAEPKISTTDLTTDSSRQQIRQNRTRSHASKIASRILFCMFVCYMPFTVAVVCYSANRESDLNRSLFWTTACTCLLNSLFNPLVYVIWMKKVREQIMVIICRKKHI